MKALLLPACTSKTLHCLNTVRSSTVLLKKSWIPDQRRFEQRRKFSMAEFPPIRLLEWWATQPFCQHVQDSLLFVHDQLGVPWWATIVGAGLTFRLMWFPIQLFLVEKKVSDASYNYIHIGKRTKEEVHIFKAYRGWSEQAKQKEFIRIFTQRAIEYNKKTGFNPNAVMLVQVSAFVYWATLFLGLRNLCGGMNNLFPGDIHAMSSMETEGILWFPNLVASYPSLSGIIFLTYLAQFALTKRLALPGYADIPTLKFKHQHKMVNQTFSGSFMMVISFFSPGALSLLLCVTALSGLAERIVFNHRKTKMLLNIKLFITDFGLKKDKEL